MQRYIILFLFIFLSACNVKAQEGSPWGHITMVKDTTIGNTYSIYAVDNAGETLVLEKQVLNAIPENTTDTIANPMVISREFSEMWSTPSYPVLINYTIKDSMLFLLHGRSGIISLQCYRMTQSGNVEKGKEYFIEHHFLISIANGAGYSYTANLLWLNNDLYMYIYGGQMYGGRVDGLYKYSFDPENSLMPASREDKLPEVTQFVSKIGFSEPDQCVWVFGISEWDRRYYEQEINQPEKYQNKKLINTLSKYIDKPYHYRIVSNNEDERYKQGVVMKNNYLTDYPLFSEKTHTKPDSLKLEKAGFYIHEMFTQTGMGVTPIKLLGYISGSQYNIYFLYLTPQNELNILIYNQYHSLWKRVQYTGKNSEPRQLWFRAGDSKEGKKKK